MKLTPAGSAETGSHDRKKTFGKVKNGAERCNKKMTRKNVAMNGENWRSFGCETAPLNPKKENVHGASARRLKCIFARYAQR